MIEFRTLGGAVLRDGDQELTRVLAQPKRLALLAYLVAHAGVFHRRDTLLSLLWPEVETARGRASLRNGLHFLRRHLGEGVILTRGDDDVAVDAHRVWHDAVAFEAAASAGRHAEALSLYAGEYLPGVFVAGAPPFDEWLDERRTRLRRMAVQAAFALSEAGDAGTVGAEELEALRRAWELALFDERLARRLMNLLDRVGDRAGALEVYTRLRQKLEREFAARPAPETEALVMRLCGREEAYPLPPELHDEGEVSVAEGSRTGEPARAPVMRPRRRWHRRVAAGSALVALGAVATGLAVLGPWSSAPAPIVVMPLANDSGDDGLAYVAEGLTFTVLSRLAEERRVRPLAGASAPAEVRGDPRLAAAALGAEGVLTWSLAKVDTSLVVHAQVLAVEDGTVLWSCDCPLRLPDLWPAEDLVVQAATDRFERRGPGPREARAAVVPPTPESRILYLQARYHWDQRTPADYWEAVRLLERAIDEDPTSAQAYAWLSNTFGAMATNGHVAPEDGFRRAEVAARRALELDPNSADARSALGAILYLRDREWDAAETELRRAIELDPGLAEAHSVLANLYRALGRYEEGIPEAEEAARLDPLAPFYPANLGKLLFCAGAPGAREQLELALQWDPTAGMAQRSLVAWWERRGEPDSALAAWHDVEAAAGNEAVMTLLDEHRADGYAAAKIAVGQAALEGARAAERRGDHVGPWRFANAYAQAGMRDEALTALEQAVAEQDPGVLWLRCNPLFDFVRDDPRLAQIERDAGLS
jgi:DNA-binding SARP family transcriptional activator/TolB-like protein/Flp pilus assembly protein TadD